jgi:hypothetical protein
LSIKFGICGGQSDTGNGFFSRRFTRKIAKSHFLTSLYLSVRLSVRMDQLGSHWTDFY